MLYTCHCHSQKYFFLIRRACLTTHPPVLYTMPNNMLCSQPMILSDSDVDQLVQVLLSLPSPRNGECPSHPAPMLTNITLLNTTLSLPELVNLLRWQPSLEALSIHNPYLTAPMKSFKYKDPVLFSVQNLTITGNPESWPVDTFVVLVAKVLSIFRSIDCCQAYVGEQLENPIQISVSATTRPLFRISEMQLTLPRDLLVPFSSSVPDIVTIPRLRHVVMNEKDWPPPLEFTFQNDSIHVEHFTLALPGGFD